MLGIIAAILIIGWLLGFFVFHITAAVIHVVVAIAIILIIFQLVNGRGRSF